MGPLEIYQSNVVMTYMSRKVENFSKRRQMSAMTWDLMGDVMRGQHVLATLLSSDSCFSISILSIAVNRVSQILFFK